MPKHQTILRCAVIAAIAAIALAGGPAAAGVDGWEPWERHDQRSPHGHTFHMATAVGADLGPPASIGISCMLTAGDVQGIIMMTVSYDAATIPDGGVAVEVTIDDRPVEIVTANIEDQFVRFPERAARGFARRFQTANQATFSYEGVRFTVPIGDGGAVIADAVRPCG